MPSREIATTRAYARKAETLGKRTWQISNIAGALQRHLLAYLIETNGDWNPNHIPAHIANILDKIGNGA